MATIQDSEGTPAQTTTIDHGQDTLPTNVIKDRLKASYDIIAPAYNSWTIPNSAQRMQYLDKLIALIPQLSSATNEERNNVSPVVRILELGCGCGVPVTQKLLSFPNAHVVANDISSTQIQLAKDALLGNTDHDNAAANEDSQTTTAEASDAKRRITFLEGDMLSLTDVPSASLDAVLGLYSIFHLPRNEQPAMLAKIHSWLKPNGVFLANFAEDEAEAVVFDKWLHNDGWMFYSGWGEEKTLDMVREAGFEVLIGTVEEDAVRAKFLWIIGRKL